MAFVKDSFMPAKAKSLLRRKSIDQDIYDSRHSAMRRVIGPSGLIALGVGTIVGAGLFSLTGVAAGQHAGPAVVLSFLIASIACALVGLCYAELASMIPSAGSAYSYTYATLGELIAWIIGWDLILEYTVGGAAVSVSWSSYFASLVHQWGISIDPRLLTSPFLMTTLADGTSAHGWVNLPAIIALTLISLLLVCGISGSLLFNNFVVFLKIGVIVLLVIFCAPHVDFANFHPFLPKNDGHFGSFGFSGMLQASGMMFFAYLGFDIIATTAQETRDPEKTMPIGILGSLVVCTILFIVFAFVLTGVVNYRSLADDASPVATAIDVTHLDWLQTVVKISLLFGYAATLIGVMLGQARVFYAMSRDGLLPKAVGYVSPKTGAPVMGHVITWLLAAFLAALFPIWVLGVMVSIGTLFAFVLVCAGVIYLRIHEPHRPRAFTVPGGLTVPILGIIVCVGMIVTLDVMTWLRLAVWLALGILVYALYGRRYSRLANARLRED